MTRARVRLRPPREGPEEQAGAFVIEESLGYLVNRAARGMAGELAAQLRPFGVGIGQWAVLMFLWAHDGMTQAELARRVAIEPPTLARTIDRMVRDGLVTRVPDPLDRRVSRVKLTPHGAGLRDDLVVRAAGVNAAMTAELTDDEVSLLKRALRTIIDASGKAHAPEG